MWWSGMSGHHLAVRQNYSIIFPVVQLLRGKEVCWEFTNRFLTCGVESIARSPHDSNSMFDGYIGLVLVENYTWICTFVAHKWISFTRAPNDNCSYTSCCVYRFTQHNMLTWYCIIRYRAYEIMKATHTTTQIPLRTHTWLTKKTQRTITMTC